MKRIVLPLLAPLLLTGVALSAPQSQETAASESWTNWRGPDGTGVAPKGNPPTEWGEDKNIRWKVALPGLGSSSPAIWGDRIYVTTAIETDREGESAAQATPPTSGRRRGRGGGSAPKKVYEFVVLALDRKDGSVVWQRTVTEAVPHERTHSTGTYASNSPITDGEHVYAFFGSRGLHCLDLDGQVRWSKHFGQMRIRAQFGEGASPALYGDTIVVNWDHEGDSFVAAFDKLTGEELWRNDRDEQTSWSTPAIVLVGRRPQVIISATKASCGYDLETGKTVWTCSGMTDNCIPTPIHVDGVVYLMSGYRGQSLQAIRLEGAKGDISDSKHIVWSHERGTSYTPSALLYDDYLYFVRGNSGTLSCLDAETGEVQYEGQRLTGMRTIYSSPVGAAGRVYLTSRTGMTKVIALSGEYQELATNQLDDAFDATAAIVGDELYLRGAKNLYSIAEE